MAPQPAMVVLDDQHVTFHRRVPQAARHNSRQFERPCIPVATHLVAEIGEAHAVFVIAKSELPARVGVAEAAWAEQ